MLTTVMATTTTKTMILMMTTITPDNKNYDKDKVIYNIYFTTTGRCLVHWLVTFYYQQENRLTRNWLLDSSPCWHGSVSDRPQTCTGTGTCWSVTEPSGPLSRHPERETRVWRPALCLLDIPHTGDESNNGWTEAKVINESRERRTTGAKPIREISLRKLDFVRVYN